MTTIAIMPESPGTESTNYRAIAGLKQATGKTAGEALDALTSQLSDSESNTLVVVQQRRPDRFFTKLQQERLQDLMTRWKLARDAGNALSDKEQAELEALVNEELHAAANRAEAVAQEMKS
jgi:hypothetical protein